ncbi:DUF7115 domain-containing protein [Halalkalirubrum salinum]|uniref:DUF7115 domain-containing protein n=1 Tax=Halalkalirubrum salinum TaxID=2563889 RepID=UPI0010FB2500|nr:hypothetical protein [Halalkalirubrum salinum]
MSLPELLETTLDEESVRERVSLGGDDVLAVTPTRVLIYRAEGLLSDESIQTYSLDAERVGVSVGRRKAKITLTYGLDGEETIAVPTKHVDTVLEPVIAGVLEAAGTVHDNESVLELFRFNDLTLVVTSDRVVKHIGAAVWDLDAEQYSFDDVVDLTFEQGSVATSIVLTLDGRQERFKTPNEQSRAVRERLTNAICTYHDVETISELQEIREAEAEVEANADAPVADRSPENADDGGSDSLDFGDTGLDPLGSNSADSAPTESTRGDSAVRSVSTTDGSATITSDDTIPEESPTTADAFEGSPFESAGPVDEEDLSVQLAKLTDAVETQAAQLERQGDLLEQLIAELRRGR